MDTFRITVGETVPIYRLSACRDESLWPRQVLGTIRKKITDSTEAADTFIRGQKRLPGKGNGEKSMLREGPPAACHYQARKEERSD